MPDGGRTERNGSRLVEEDAAMFAGARTSAELAGNTGQVASRCTAG